MCVFRKTAFAFIKKKLCNNCLSTIFFSETDSLVHLLLIAVTDCMNEQLY